MRLGTARFLTFECWNVSVLGMPDAYRRRRLFVAATSVLVAVLVVAFAWAVRSRPDHPSTPRLVVQSAQRAGDELSVTPAELAGVRLQSCAKQVIEDWYSDGRVNKLYPLACYAAAIDLVPVRDFSPPRQDIERALEFARRGKLAPSAPGRGVFFVTKGMTRQQVRALAGKPYRAGALCWLFHATDAARPNVIGMRICFADDHVSKTQISVHG